jgi:hypothetical protein
MRHPAHDHALDDRDREHVLSQAEVCELHLAAKLYVIKQKPLDQAAVVVRTHGGGDVRN